MRSLRKIPKFRNEDQERGFWSRTDSTDYLDYSKARKALFPNLKPSTKTISVRLPEGLLVRLKLAANKRDVPYQSLLKIYLSEMLDRESANTSRSVSRVRKAALRSKEKG
jgi:predicted DNA binding CopG/RHH family protein